LLVAGVPVLATSQELPANVVQQINASTKARVRLVGGGSGTLYSPKADPTSLSSNRSSLLDSGGTAVSGSQLLPIAQLAEIQVAHGSHAGSGAKIGGGLGAALALLAVALTSGQDYVSPTTGQAVAAVVGWTGIGAGIGALIGSASPRWQTVYLPPAP
jgi:hypothetical protein